MRILYIDLDCLRADHVGLNGYHRDTTPNIDRIGRQGITFTQCHCANSPCVPSRASLFSGRFGINNGVIGHHGVGEEFRRIWRSHWTDRERPMLQWHLWQAGMKTVSFSSFADRHNAFWFCNGWEELHTFTRKRGNERADEVNAAFLPWFKLHCREDNWFVHLHYWDIHCMYRQPAEWAKRFEDSEPPAWPDEETIASHQDFYGPRTATDLYFRQEEATPIMPPAVRNRTDFKQLIDGYDGAIAYADDHIGQALNVLADAGVLDETAIIISGDHGDSFGENGMYIDHCIANNPVHNVSMIVRWPGMPGGLKCDELIYGMDLGPTLCELLGLDTPPKWDGRPFTAAVRGEEFQGWPYQIWDHGIYTFTRSVRTRDHLLINILHPGLYPIDEPYLLYDLRTDPHQSRNVADEQPDTVGSLQAKLLEWKQEQIEKGAAPDPLEAMVAEGPFIYWTPEMMGKRLDATGRSHRKEDLKRRLREYHGSRYDAALS